MVKFGILKKNNSHYQEIIDSHRINFSIKHTEAMTVRKSYIPFEGQLLMNGCRLISPEGKFSEAVVVSRKICMLSFFGVHVALCILTQKFLIANRT